MTNPRGDEEKVGSGHGEDEEEEESVVSLTNAAVEKKAVVVVVFDAHVTQLAVLCAVRLEQLRGEQQQGQKKLAPNLKHGLWSAGTFYLTGRTKSLGILVALQQVGDAGEPRVCVCSVQRTGVLGQNLEEQTEQYGKVDQRDVSQNTGWPQTFTTLRMELTSLRSTQYHTVFLIIVRTVLCMHPLPNEMEF